MKCFRVLFILYLLALSAGAQLPFTKTPVPDPPPLHPEAAPGEPAPFDPDQTREAQPEPPLELQNPLPADPEAPTDSLTLLQAVELALRLQPDMRTARGSLTQAEGEVVQQRSNLLPRLSVSSSFIHSSSPQGGTSGVSSLASVGTGQSLVTSSGANSDQLSTSLGVSQLLFDFGRTRNLIKQADYQRQAAAATLLQTENEVTLSVKEAFYNAILARRLVEVREDDLNNRQEQLRMARALYDAGELAPGDVVRAQSEVTNTVVSLNTARQDYELALQDQSQILGLPPLTDVQMVETSEPDLPDKSLAYLFERANERRPDLLVVQRNVDAGEAALAAAQALNRPALSTFTGITYQGDVTTGVQRPTFTAQLQLDFDVYDGGARAGAVKSAEGALEIARADLRRVRLTVEKDISSAVTQLLTAERNVTAASSGVESARQGVRISQGRYQVALGTLTDVFDTQATLVTAQINLANSLTDLDLARARLRYAIASPFEEGFFPENQL